MELFFLDVCVVFMNLTIFVTVYYYGTVPTYNAYEYLKNVIIVGTYVFVRSTYVLTAFVCTFCARTDSQSVSTVQRETVSTNT